MNTDLRICQLSSHIDATILRTGEGALNKVKIHIKKTTVPTHELPFDGLLLRLLHIVLHYSLCT